MAEDNTAVYITHEAAYKIGAIGAYNINVGEKLASKERIRRLPGSEADLAGFRANASVPHLLGGAEPRR